MIALNQLPALLIALGFTKKDASYTETMGAVTLEVNTAKQEIIYPRRLGDKRAANLQFFIQ